MPVRRNMRGLWIWICLLLVLGPALARSEGEKKPEATKPEATKPEATKPAAKPPELPARIAYLQGLDTFLKGQGGSIPSVFALGRAAAREQLDAVLEWDQAIADGKVPKRKFEPVLPGFHVGTGKALFVVVNSRFFLELARQRGTDVDRRFFALLHQTYGGSRSRVYVEPITDTTGCFHLGGREFIGLYRDWTRFKASNPKAYSESVTEEIQSLEQTLLTATCACGTRETVDAGFEAFLKVFPKSPIAPQVRARVDKLHTNTSDLIFSCGQELDLGQPLPYGVKPPPYTP